MYSSYSLLHLFLLKKVVSFQSESHQNSNPLIIVFECGLDLFSLFLFLWNVSPPSSSKDVGDFIPGLKGTSHHYHRHEANINISSSKTNRYVCLEFQRREQLELQHPVLLSLLFNRES